MEIQTFEGASRQVVQHLQNLTLKLDSPFVCVHFTRITSTMMEVQIQF